MSMLSRQMLLLEPKGEYADVLERELFNGAIAGISLDGKQYYYVNALESTPDGLDNPDRHHVLSHRVDWFGCACCPANIARLIASVDRYMYTERDGGKPCFRTSSSQTKQPSIRDCTLCNAPTCHGSATSNSK